MVDNIRPTEGRPPDPETQPCSNLTDPLIDIHVKSMNELRQKAPKY